MIKVSVIIPVFNTGHYLRKCLDSVLGQTLREIEIICVDDGSTDNSASILLEYQEKYENFVAVFQENLGQSAARNKGLSVAKGEYIGFVDSDDWVDSKMYEKLYENALKHDSEIVMCGVNTIDERDGSFSDSDPYLTLDLFGSEFDDRSFCALETKDFLFRICVSACNKIFKRDFLIENELTLPQEFMMAEDNVFFMETFLKAKRCSLVRDKFYYYRVCSSTSTVFGSDYKKMSLFRVCRAYKKILKKNGFYKDKDLKKYFKSWRKDTLFYWAERIQDVTVKTKYRKKLLIKYPETLFDKLKQKIKYNKAKKRMCKLLKSKKVVFWGASDFLKNFLESFLDADSGSFCLSSCERKNIVGVVDKSSQKQGKEFLSFIVESPETLRCKDFDVVIPAVVNIYNFEKILETELALLNVKKEIVKVF